MHAFHPSFQCTEAISDPATILKAPITPGAKRQKGDSNISLTNFLLSIGHFSYVNKAPMFRDNNEDFVVIFLSTDQNPLSGWDVHVENGFIKKMVDHAGASEVPALEIVSTKVNSTHIVCPRDPKEELGIQLPYFNMVMKYLDKYFTFELEIKDDLNTRRTIRASNFQSTSRVKPQSCALPLRLGPGWNQIKMNIPDFVKRTFGTNYVETLRVSVFANCRIARVAFSDRPLAEDEVPSEYRLITDE